MALVPLCGFTLVREVCEWALNVIGYWKLLLGMCVLYGLHILQVAIMRVIDSIFSTRFVSWSLSSFVENFAWRFLQPLILHWAPGWIGPWFMGPALELPSGTSSAVVSVSSEYSKSVGRGEPLESVMGTHMTLAASFIIHLVVLMRRRL